MNYEAMPGFVHLRLRLQSCIFLSYTFSLPFLISRQVAETAASLLSESIRRSQTQLSGTQMDYESVGRELAATGVHAPGRRAACATGLRVALFN